MPGRLVDLSLSGCRLETEQLFLAGVMMRVEVQFELRGIAFRLLGVTLGSRPSKSFAVRFLDISERRQQALAEVLAEVAEINAAKKSEDSPKTAEPGDAGIQRETFPPAQAKKTPVSEAPAVRARQSEFRQPADATPQPEPEVRLRVAKGTPAPSAVSRDRRLHGRHEVDTRANLLLVNTNICMPGQILNLSQGGCRLRTDERFNVGIFVRVEAEFYLHGLPFRLAGVTQAVMDKHNIGVRFLDMSDRRREQLTELIAEIEETETVSSKDTGERAAGGTDV